MECGDVHINYIFKQHLNDFSGSVFNSLFRTHKGHLGSLPNQVKKYWHWNDLLKRHVTLWYKRNVRSC